MSVNTSTTEQVIEPKISLAIKQIEAFGDKYGADHLDLAMHLAFPLAITADLAYRIWGEFCQGVAWVAVSDCLLSYLWHEVDNGLYEVDVTVRQVLLHELQHSKLGEDRLRGLARFLLVQLQEYSQGGEVRRLHELIAWSYQDKEKAAAAIVKTINSLVWSQSSLELIRIGTIINSVAVSLRTEYADLFTVSATMLQYGYGNVEGAISNINNLSDVSVLKIAGMNLLIPRFFQFETVTVNRKGEEILPREKKLARYYTELLPGGVELDMVEIPGGKFIMGSPADEENRYDDEGPQHEVTIQPFFMGKYPVTQSQYEAIMGENPSDFKGEKRPVENVSWDKAVEFCEKLSKLAGRKYSLPSEAQWEYAGRAGTITPFYFGETITSDLANYDGNYTYAEEPKGKYREETTEVGIFPPNAFGLYDIHGNVYEWCEDIWHDNYEGAPDDASAWISLDEKTDENYSRRLLRGGFCVINPVNCRVAYRASINRAGFVNGIGFRVSCAVL
jgi:formylglycine-generating enzyme required for sulfatase activity